MVSNDPRTAIVMLGKLIGCNMNITTDNIIPFNPPVGNAMVTAIYVTNASGNLTTAAGGVYTAATKGGTVLVANTQVYSTLTGATIWLPLTMAASPIKVTAGQIFLNLTTAQGSAMTADVYVFGFDISLA